MPKYERVIVQPEYILTLMAAFTRRATPLFRMRAYLYERVM